MQWLLFVHLPRLSDTPRNWLDQKKNKFSVKVNSTLRLFDLFLKAIKRSYIWLIYTLWIWIGTLAWIGSRTLEIRKRIDQSHNATDSKKSVTAAEIPSVGPKFVNENNLPPPPPKKKERKQICVQSNYHLPCCRKKCKRLYYKIKIMYTAWFVRKLRFAIQGS